MQPDVFCSKLGIPKTCVMKYIYFFLFSCSSLFSSAQSGIGFSYSCSAPLGDMSKNIGTIHSLTMDYMYRLPGKWNRLEAGVDMGWGIYASQRKKQTFTFTDGSTTTTWVNYNSNMVQGGIQARLRLTKDRLAVPYLSGKIGYHSLYSNIYVEDPEDEGGCKALQQRNIIKDGSITASYGGGVLVDLALFSPKSRKERVFFNLSVQHTAGGRIDYINTKKLIDANNPPVGTDGKPLNLQFINASTQQIHEHQVAQVFNSPLRMLDCRLSMFFLLK